MGQDLAKNLTPACRPKEVEVTQPSDLPSPVGDQIFGKPDTLYMIYGTVDITPNCFVKASGTVLQGRTYPSAGIDTLRSTNSTYVVKQEFGELLIDRLAIVQGGSGEAIYVDEPTSFHQMERTFTTGGLRVVSGNMNILLSTFFGDGLIVDSTYSGALGGFGIENVNFVNTGAGQAGLELEAGAVVGFLNVIETAFTTTTGSNGIMVDSPGQITGAARIENGAMLGTGVFLSGLDQKAGTWRFRNQINVPDSRNHAVSGAAPASSVTIDLDANGTGEWVPLGDGGVLITYTLDDGAERINLTDADTGELTVAGMPLDQKVYAAMLSATMERTSGQDVNVQIGISVGGADPTPACYVQGVASNRPSQIMMSPCLIDLPFGSTVTPMVRNVDAAVPTNDIDLHSVKNVLAE